MASRTNQSGYEPDEITVTPEMIAAGAFVLEQSARFFDERALAKLVYTAMRAASGGREASTHHAAESVLSD